jgi:hypothetical protein
LCILITGLVSSGREFLGDRFDSDEIFVRSPIGSTFTEDEEKETTEYYEMILIKHNVFVSERDRTLRSHRSASGGERLVIISVDRAN